jgi:hypothetical protein
MGFFPIVLWLTVGFLTRPSSDKQKIARRLVYILRGRDKGGGLWILIRRVCGNVKLRTETSAALVKTLVY